MPPQWEVVGGRDKGGILVRKGEDVGSEQEKARLSFGALVQELELKGERLHYRLLGGTGPLEGWVSLKLPGKELLIHRGEADEADVKAAEDLAKGLKKPKVDVCTFALG